MSYDCPASVWDTSYAIVILCGKVGTFSQFVGVDSFPSVSHGGGTLT